MTELRIALSDGRKVQIQEYGDPSGAPALWFHGAFSSRLEAWSLDAPAQELGIRVIALDRPGLGGSDNLPGRTVTGYAADVREVLDSLGIERAAVGGLSNGGMYTMAVASGLPERVLRAVPYNSSTPIADPAARAALSRTARLSYAFMQRRADKLDDMVTRPRGRVLTAISRRSNPDTHLYSDPRIAAAQAANAAEASRQPRNGYLQTEIAHCTGPWGFDHRAVAVPVTVVSGVKDAGLGYAKVWADELPQGRLVTVPGGHGGMPAPVVSRRLVELLAGHA
jgi:pimeloyl-ACP methyl ester carboxylesterase